MRPTLLGFVVVALSLAVSFVQAQGVIVPEGGFAETAVSSTGAGSDIYHGLVGANVPADDGNKWNVTLFVDGTNPASQQVIANFSQDADLRAIADWGHFNVLDVNRLSQQERFRVFQVAGANLPALCIYPPQNSRTYPYQYVVRQSGADLVALKPRDLAVHVVTQVRAFVQRITGRDCVGPWCPAPNRPQPQPQPTPTPYPPSPTPSPDIMPPLPSIPDVPDIAPQPTPATPAEPAVGNFPDYALVTIIVDPHGLGEAIKAKGLEMIIERVAARYSGFERPKARVIRLTDPEAKAYPVGPADTPAAVLTHRGRIVGYVTGLVLDVMKENLNLPTPLPDAPQTTVHVDNSGIESAIEEQSRLADARDAALLASNERTLGMLSSLAAVLGISIPGAGLILAVGLGVAAYVWKRRGGVEGYRKRREKRLNWVHDRLPPAVAARTRRLRNRLRRRFGVDAVPEDAEEMEPEELEELEQELEAEAAEVAAETPASMKLKSAP